MANRLDNLGDYNVVRNDLQAHGGDVESLYKEIGDTAVAKERPAIKREGQLEGFGYAAIFFGGLYVCKKGYDRFKRWRNDRRLIKSEPELKEKFVEVAQKASESENTVTNEEME